MILALDVHYRANGARTAGLAFAGWSDAAPSRIYTDFTNVVADYEPGAFYKRELPCLLGLLQQVPMEEVRLLVVDGYVHLGLGHPGLGAHLFEVLNRSVPVAGVAKSYFKGAEDFALPLLRGESKVPLWITAVGMDAHNVLRGVQQMQGQHRLPDLLRQLDTLSRTE